MRGHLPRGVLAAGAVLLASAVAVGGIILSQPDGSRPASLASVLAGPSAETGVVELSGETLAGASFDIAEFRGTPVFINVWASW